MISLGIVLPNEKETEFVQQNLPSNLFSGVRVQKDWNGIHELIDSEGVNCLLVGITDLEAIKTLLIDLVVKHPEISLIFYTDTISAENEEFLQGFQPLSIIEKNVGAEQFRRIIQLSAQLYKNKAEFAALEISLESKNQSIGQMLQNNANPALIIEKSRIIDCNNSFLSYFEIAEKEQVLANYFYQYLPNYQVNGEHSVIYFERILLGLDQSNNLPFGLLIKKNETKTETVETRVLILDSVTEHYFIEMMVDKSLNLKGGNEDLAQSPYENVYLHANVGFLIVDAVLFKIIEANPYALSVMRLEHNQLKSKKIAELFPSDFLHYLHHETHSNLMQIVPLKTKDGEIMIQAQISSLNESPNNRILISFLPCDINESKDNATLLEEYQKQERDIQKIAVENQRINESLLYARKIQSALMPPDEYLKKYTEDFFIFWHPKEIVSGDFYWANYRNGHFFLALADATGHGVPAAFMSILGMSYLNEITLDMEKGKASQVLDILRNKIIKSLNQDGGQDEMSDGFDMSLLIINPEKMRMQFSAANMSVYMIRNRQLVEIKGDRMAVGINLKAEFNFTNHQYRLQKGDKIYLFSDGLTDQFGGESNKKLYNSGLKQMILEIEDLPMKMQKDALTDSFSKWKNEQEQIDDILLIGIQV